MPKLNTRVFASYRGKFDIFVKRLRSFCMWADRTIRKGHTISSKFCLFMSCSVNSLELFKIIRINFVHMVFFLIRNYVSSQQTFLTPLHTCWCSSNLFERISWKVDKLAKYLQWFNICRNRDVFVVIFDVDSWPVIGKYMYLLSYIVKSCFWDMILIKRALLVNFPYKSYKFSSI